MTLRSRLTTLFSPNRSWAGDDASVQWRGGLLGPQQTVFPRSRLIHRRIGFAGLPKAQRQAAAHLAARRLYPQGSEGHLLRWQGDQAHVWIIEGAAPADQVANGVAESTLMAMPATPSAARLVALRDGVEGQLWRDGLLQASRWWPLRPGPEDWQQFLRGAGVPADTPLPATETVDTLPEPWGESPGSAYSPAQLERGFWRGLAVLALLVLGWQLAGETTWRLAEVWQQRALAIERERSAPLMAARESADSDLASLEQYALLMARHDDYQLVAEVLAGVPEGAVIASWLREGDTLRVEVQASQADPRLYVAAFQSHPRLRDAVANPIDGGRMVLEFRLPPLQPEADDAA